MKKTFCDRCGGLVNISSNTNVYGTPQFYIHLAGPYDMNVHDVDLCIKCEKELYDWIYNILKDDSDGEK